MKLLGHMLKPYTLIEATTAEQALQLFIDHDRQIDVLVADVTLPKGSGIQVALLLRSQLRHWPVILTSGYPVSSWSNQDSADLKRLRPNSVTMLQTPFEAQVLQDAVRELIGAPLEEKARTA